MLKFIKEKAEKASGRDTESFWIERGEGYADGPDFKGVLGGQ